MTYKFMDEQLLGIAERHKLNYSYNSNCFKLFDDDKIGKLSIIIIGEISTAFMIEIDGNEKYLSRASDFRILYLLSVLGNRLNNGSSFSNALKEMWTTHEKIQKIEKELKSNENSTN